jgi:hypothetical protein
VLAAAVALLAGVAACSSSATTETEADAGSMGDAGGSTRASSEASGDHTTRETGSTEGRSSTRHDGGHGESSSESSSGRSSRRHDGGETGDGGEKKDGGADARHPKDAEHHDAERDSGHATHHDSGHHDAGRAPHDAAHDAHEPEQDGGGTTTTTSTSTTTTTVASSTTTTSMSTVATDAGHDAGPQCGVGFATLCSDGTGCSADGDCESLYCKGHVCTAASCHDGVKDGDETGVDCGGSCPPCANGNGCLVGADCTSLVCFDAVITAATASTTGAPIACPDGATCTCQAPSDIDGVKNDGETDVDCGGALLVNGKASSKSDGAPACAVGKSCLLGNDCTSLVCFDTSPATRSANGKPINCPVGSTCTCLAPTDMDGVQNDSETGIDCGGAEVNGVANPTSDGAPPCGNGDACTYGTDCASGVCNDNGDLGGPPVDCPALTSCVCQRPSDDDGVQNGGETAVDCGGATWASQSDGAPPCAPGLTCYLNADCQSSICQCPVGGCDFPTGVTGVCTTPTDTDGVQNDSETDVDCGGVASPTSDGAPACQDAKKCLVATDCLSGYCSTISYTCVDGLSCVGLVTPAQILDPNPAADNDADGNATGTPDPFGIGENAGIDTCGTGESTDMVHSHESCCKSLLVTVSAPGSCTYDGQCTAPQICNLATGSCELRIDKYEVTSGRIRQFLEGQTPPYDVRDWALAQFTTDGNFTPVTPAGEMLAAQIPTGTPAQVAAGVTNALYLLPQSASTSDPLNAIILTGALVMDTTGVQGCFTNNGDAYTAGAGGAATYWWDGVTLNEMAGSTPRPFTQDMYDIKPMNCIPYYLAATFCAWDGGRLELETEHALIWQSTTQAYPWGQNFLPNPYPGNQAIAAECGGNYAPNCAVSLTVDWFNGSQSSGSQGDFYYYPSYPASIPNSNVPDSLTYSWDLSPYIAAPGRFYLDATSLQVPTGQACSATSPCPANGTCSGGVCYDSWQDLGADMIEWGAVPAAQLTTGTEQMCDQSGVLGSGETYNCQSGLGGDDGINGVIRGNNLPPADLLGGSWEGHQVVETLIPQWSFYRQYGKTGLRCVRAPEP